MILLQTLSTVGVAKIFCKYIKNFSKFFIRKAVSLKHIKSFYFQDMCEKLCVCVELPICLSSVCAIAHVRARLSCVFHCKPKFPVHEHQNKGASDPSG